MARISDMELLLQTCFYENIIYTLFPLLMHKYFRIYAF